jgi:hypothetical protein
MRFVAFVALFNVAAWSGSIGAAENKQYRLEIRFFKVSTAAETDPGEKFIVPDGPTIVEDNLQWDPDISRFSNVKHVNSIEMICKMNSKSTLKIQSEETIESLIPDDDANSSAGRTFRLSKTRHPDALEMAVVLNKQADGPLPYLLHYKTEISQLAGRAPIDGVQLDVGKPVVQKSTIESSMRLKLGLWFINSLHLGDGRHIILVGKLVEKGN